MSGRVVVAACLALLPLAALAQAHDRSSMPGMEMAPQPASKPKPATKKKTDDAPAMDHATMDHGVPSATQAPAVPATDHGAMQHDMPTGESMTHDMPDAATPMATSPAMDSSMASSMASSTAPSMKPMQGGAAPADARDPDAYADGLPRDSMHGMDMDDDARHLYVLVDRLEAVHARATHGQSLDAQAWYGGDLDKLWLKVDGGRVDGRLGATRTEALWNHAIASYWGLQAGVRQDFGDGPGRTWASLGVQGLAPYWFDVQATAYAGEGGRTALRLEVEYDLRITQRLILQPDLKVDAYGRDDARRGIGAGFSQVQAGLRLRYEVARKLAPYVGVVWNRSFGNTARFARAADEPVRKIEAVAGIRFWF